MKTMVFDTMGPHVELYHSVIKEFNLVAKVGIRAESILLDRLNIRLSYFISSFSHQRNFCVFRKPFHSVHQLFGLTPFLH